MFDRLREIRTTIRFKVLSSLFVLLAFSFVVSLVGIWTFERDSYIDIARGEAMRAARTVEQALRHAMLENNWEKAQQSLDHIQEIVAPDSVSIVKRDGTVALSSREDMVGQRFDRERDPSCQVCHQQPGAPPLYHAAFIDTKGGTILRNIVTVVNAPECHRCHNPAEQILGVIVYDTPFAKIFAMLRAVLLRIALTGVATFLLVVIVLSLVVQRYVHRPLQQLEEGFIHVGRGNFDHWVTVSTEGEIQSMADQFNVMNQAIKRSFAEIKRKNWETEQLYAFVRDLGRTTEWRRLRRVILDLLSDTFDVQRVALLLRRESQEKMLVEISWREEVDRRYFHREYPENGQEVDLPQWLEAVWKKWREQPPKRTAYSEDDATFLAPLYSRNISLGMLCLSREAGRPFNGMDKKLLAALIEQLETTLANARLYRMAITDGLTGLYSKRYCESVLRSYLDAYEADRQRQFNVLMLDLDHFKLVNDTHGHQAGDEVLNQLGAIIRATIRQDDTACRYGGEEFIVLAGGTLQEGQTLADRLVRTVAGHCFLCGSGLELQNTVSIGVANFPDHGRTTGEVIGAADQALYRAKQEGRNRFVSQLPASDKPLHS